MAEASLANTSRVLTLQLAGAFLGTELEVPAVAASCCGRRRGDGTSLSSTVPKPPSLCWSGAELQLSVPRGCARTSPASTITYLVIYSSASSTPSQPWAAEKSWQSAVAKAAALPARGRGCQAAHAEVAGEFPVDVSSGGEF